MGRPGRGGGMSETLPGIPAEAPKTQRQERAEARARHEALVALYSEQLRPRVVARVAEIMDAEIDREFRRCVEGGEFRDPGANRYVTIRSLIMDEIRKVAAAKVSERLQRVEVSVRLPEEV